MSEEEKLEEQAEEVKADEQPSEESSDNVIFNALYAAAEEEQEEEEEVREPYTGPTSIHSALAEEPEPEVQEEQRTEPEQKEESAPKPKAKSKIKRKIIDPEFSIPQDTQPRAAPRRKAPVDPFVEELLPEEKEAYQISRWAAQNVQGQQGLDNKYLDFFKKHKKFLKDNSDYDLSDSEDYKKFLDQNKPKIDLKKFEKEMWASEAEGRALKRLQPELLKLRRDQARIQGEPLAKEKIHNAKKVLFDTIPDDTRKIIQGSGIKGLFEQSPIEAKIINDSLTNAQDMVNTFYNIVHSVEDYNEKDAKHSKLSDFISKEQEKFINSGRTVRGGKTFVRRERMPLVPKDQVSKYYTFSDEDIINLIALRAKEAINNKISSTRSALEKAGYTKNGVQVAQPQQQVQQPRKIQTPTPSKGVSAPATPQPEQSNSILKLLDL